MHTHRDTSGHICVCTQRHIRTCMCAHRDTSGRVHVCTQTHISTYMCAHTVTHQDVSMCTHRHTNRATCAHTHTRAHSSCVSTAVGAGSAQGQPWVPMAERGRSAWPGPGQCPQHPAVTPAAPRHRSRNSPPSLPRPRPLRRHRRDVGSQKIISFPEWPRGSGNMKLTSSQPISKTLDTSVSASEFFF